MHNDKTIKPINIRQSMRGNNGRKETASGR